VASGFHAACAGSIKGLRLPFNAWLALNRAGITTLDQLRAWADQIERIDRIGPKTAHTIRQELARAGPAAFHRATDG
jgi:hypothetical protein